MKNILFEQSAVKVVLEELKMKGYKWRNIRYINQGRYAIVYGVPNIFIQLKKEWFLKFAEICKDKGIGDTINNDDIKQMIKEKVKDIYIIHKSGAIYTIPLMDFLLKSKKWRNKEGKDVRSISIHNYTRINQEGEA